MQTFVERNEGFLPFSPFGRLYSASSTNHESRITDHDSRFTIHDYSVCPHPEQNRAPGGFVRWHFGQAVSVAGCPITAGGTSKGCPHPGISIPSIAAIAAACIALNSRTRPGMKKHSINPRSPGIPVQKKQQ